MGSAAVSAGVSAVYRQIPDSYKQYDEVVEAMKSILNGASTQLIVGLDFSKSNDDKWLVEYKGDMMERSLHNVKHRKKLGKNPYEQVFTMIWNALECLDSDGLFPVYGFGDAHTGSDFVFAFEMDEPPRAVTAPFPLIRPPRDMPCEGLEGALERYEEIAHEVSLGGPTSFAPIIRQSVYKIREACANQNVTPEFHILLIIADGQVSQSEKMATELAIDEASNYPLSIICIGVGDGPWDMMEKYDDKVRRRRFDNFQFVDFKTVFAKYPYIKRKDAFAVHALQQVPSQIRACKLLGYLKDDWEMPMNFKMPPKPIGPPDMLRWAPEDDPSYSMYAAVNPSFGVVDTWTAVWHHKLKRYFYMNKDTGESLWDKPTTSIYCPAPIRKEVSEFTPTEYTDNRSDTNSMSGSRRSSRQPSTPRVAGSHAGSRQSSRR